MTIQLFADGTLVTRDKSGTNYSQVKLEDLGLDMTMLEGNTDIELLIVQGDGKEVRATINTSKHVNPTTESVTRTTNSTSAISSVASGKNGSKDDVTAVTRSTESTVTATSNESRPYKCSMCPRTFKFYRTFRCHEIVHTKAVTFTCHLCQRLFAREVNLNSHLELHKKKGAALKSENEKEKGEKLEKWDCNLCEKEFGGYHALKRHKEQVHGGIAKIPCPICGKEFKNESNVQRHSRVHVGPFTCPHCVTVFMEREDYNEHIKNDHADLMYPCSVCDTVLPSKKAYVRHVNNVHKDADGLKELMKKFECSVCNKMFVKQNLLDKHMLSHSSESDQECPKCHKTFKALWTLEHHIKAEHNNEVVFTCSECDEEFALKNKLDLHVKLYHSGHYQCLECYDEFPQRVLLEEHQFTNHDLGFACSKCKNKFETSAKLKQHLTEHISKNFLCDTCGSGFEFKPQLRSHLTEKHFARDRADMLKHHPEMSCINKEILCDLCGEYWTNRPLYKQHLRDVHFGGDSVALLKIFPQFEKVSDPPEPVTCDHCSKVCASLVQLNAHLKVHMKSKHKTRPKVEDDITDDEQDDPVDFTNIEPREMDREYKCLTCNAEFARKAALEKHLTTHHKKDELREALRDIEREELARAELEEKEGRKPTPAKSKKKKIVDSSDNTTKAAKTTLSAPKTLVKTKVVSAEAGSIPKRRCSQMHVCKICEEIFKTTIELAIHLKDEHDHVDLIHNEEDGDMGSSDVVGYDLTTYQCFSCDKDFKCRKYLCRHLRKVHKIRQRIPIASLTEDKNVFKCTKCGKGFGKAVNMRRHMAAKHGLRSPANSAESPVKTRGSNKTDHRGKEKIEDPDDDYEPMETNSQANSGDSTADITSFLGMNFNLGKSHSCNIESVKKKQHRCRLCGVGFSREATLKKHFVLHDTYTDVHTKPDADDISELQPAIYPCNACGNMYSTALGLIHHNRSKHADVDEEIVLAQIAEIDTIIKAASPKKKVDKDTNKSVKRKSAPGGEDEHDVARKRVKLDQDGRDSYDCRFCGAVYYTYKGLSYHERDVHNADKMGSPQKEGSTRYSMSGRLITRSKKLSDMIQCYHCTKTFMEEKNLKIHMVRVHNTEVKAEKTRLLDTVVIENKSAIGFRCHLCTKEFGLRVNLRRHVKMKHNVELLAEGLDISVTESPEKASVLVYHCDVCEQKFSTMSILRHHMISVHDENDENTLEIKIEIPSCDVCHQEFATQKTLDVHMRKHTGEKPYTCCLCNKQFISKYQLECHMKKLHAKLWVKKVRCKICLMLFDTEKAMFKHKVIHLKPVSSVEEPSHHKCTRCEKVFKWKRNLESHVEVYHNGSDPLTCGVCNKVFPDRESIGNHMTEHQGKKTVYSCEICDKSFPKESSLRMHVGQLHKAKTTLGGSLSCDICKNSFTTKIKLLEHMLSHTSMMPHKCDKCSASFKQEFRLKAHILTHTLQNLNAENLKPVYTDEQNKEVDTMNDLKQDLSRKRYKCKKCGKNFNKAWLMKAHTAKAHKPALIVASALSRNKVRTRSRSTSESKVVPLKKTSQAVQKKSQKQKKIVTTVMKKPIKSVGFCKQCKLKFFKIDAFKLHMKNVHPKPIKTEHSKTSQDKSLKSKKVEKKLPPPKPSTSKSKLEQSKKSYQLQVKKANKLKKRTDTTVKKRKEIVGHDCPICKKIFSQRFNLKIHIRNVHKVQMEDSPSKTEVQRKKCLFCTECARVFWSQMQYDSHNKRVHPDKAAVELDKRVMQELNDEIKTEPTDGLSSPKQTEFETIKHKCEFCPIVHWTKKLFDEHMLIDHPEHAEEYGISAADTSRPTIELVNDSEDMMGDMLSVGHYDVTTCDKLSSFPVVSIQRITEKLVSLSAENNEEEDPSEMEVNDTHEESGDYADNSIVEETSRIETESLPISNYSESIVDMVKKQQSSCADGEAEASGFTCDIDDVKTVHSNTEMVTKDFQDSDKNEASICTGETTEITRPIKSVDDQYTKEYEKFLKKATSSINDIQDVAVEEESAVDDTIDEEIEQNQKMCRKDIFIEEESDEYATQADSADEKTTGEATVIEKETVENTVIEDFEKDTADADGNGTALSGNSSITEVCNEQQPTEKDTKENEVIRKYIAEEVAETDTVGCIDSTKSLANKVIEKEVDTEIGEEQEASCEKIENDQGIGKGSSEAENMGDSENDEKQQEGIDCNAIDSEIGAIENEDNLVACPAKAASDYKSLMLDEDTETKCSSDEAFVDVKFGSGGSEQMIGDHTDELHRESKDDREVSNAGLTCEQENGVETVNDCCNSNTTEIFPSENKEDNDEIKEQLPTSGHDNDGKVDVDSVHVCVNKLDNIVETVLHETEDIKTSTSEIVGCSKLKNAEDDKEKGAFTDMKGSVDSLLHCDALFMGNKQGLENTKNEDLANTEYEEMDLS